MEKQSMNTGFEDLPKHKMNRYKILIDGIDCTDSMTNEELRKMVDEILKKREKYIKELDELEGALKE